MEGTRERGTLRVGGSGLAPLGVGMGSPGPRHGPGKRKDYVLVEKSGFPVKNQGLAAII